MRHHVAQIHANCKPGDLQCRPKQDRLCFTGRTTVESSSVTLSAPFSISYSPYNAPILATAGTARYCTATVRFVVFDAVVARPMNPLPFSERSLKTADCSSMMPAQFCRLPAATGTGVKENDNEVHRPKRLLQDIPEPCDGDCYGSCDGNCDRSDDGDDQKAEP